MTTEFFAEGCSAPDKGRLLEDYLGGALTEERAATFEEHYFTCSACLEAIRLRQSGPHAFGHGSRGIRSTGHRLRYSLGIVTMSVVIIVMLVVAYRHELFGPASRNSKLSLAELSRVTAPAYVPSSSGGGGDEPRRRFVEAMQLYAAGDFAGAIPGLEASWEGDRSRAETGFYLGASYLVTNRVDRAIATLRITTALGGSPFLDRSKLLLAKAYVRRLALDDAVRELHEVAGHGGALGAEAERLIDAIDRAANTQR